jgi:hypothetical protein
MVAEHLASLPPPPPLVPHVSILAAYEGREVPPPPDIVMTTHTKWSQNLPPQPQPQPEVVVDLVFDHEE